jgi:hypothetical protein
MLWKVSKCHIFIGPCKDTPVHVMFLSSPEEICIYFDGGIASVCVLHLYYAFTKKDNSIPSLQAVCIKEKQRLPELESFVVETMTRCI